MAKNGKISGGARSPDQKNPAYSKNSWKKFHRKQWVTAVFVIDDG